MGIALTYQSVESISNFRSSLAYFSISLSPNVLPTLMIAMWLVLHSGNTHTALGRAGIGGLCKDIATMLIVSRAPYPLRRELIASSWAVECSEQCFPMTAIFGQIV